MSEDLTDLRVITTEMVTLAVNVVIFRDGPTIVERPRPGCERPRLCVNGCTYPRYQNDGVATGLIGKVLIQLGYPNTLLKDLDLEHEVGDVLHAGVKLVNSRNAALNRIDVNGMKLLGFLQQQVRHGVSWGDASIAALCPRRPRITFLDKRRRPWRY